MDLVENGLSHVVGQPRQRLQLPELNVLIAAGVSRDDQRHVAHRRITVAEHFALEADTLRPLPAEGFDISVVSSHRVDRKARVSVRGCLYSVPAAHVGKRLDVRVGAETIEALNGAVVVARHPRALKGDEVLALDHYLEVLAIKTGAFVGATALARARATGVPAVEAHPLTRFRACAASTATSPRCDTVYQNYYGSTVHLRGRVVPAHDGRVGVYRKRHNSNRWVKVGTAAIGPNGHFRWAWRTSVFDTNNRGPYQFAFRLKRHDRSNVVRVWIIRDI